MNNNENIIWVLKFTIANSIELLHQRVLPYLAKVPIHKVLPFVYNNMAQ